jgi:hypothetical protein
MTFAVRAILAATLAIGASVPATGCNSYDFRPHATFDVAAIKRLSGAPLIVDAPSTTATGAQLVALPFDREDHPIYGRWRALAVIYVTRGDLGEDTIGGLLLQARNDPPMDLATARTVKDGTGAELRLAHSRTCPAYVVRLRADGTLIVQGKAIGKLAD